jgi:predicted HAD superfamily hydrolase
MRLPARLKSSPLGRRAKELRDTRPKLDLARLEAACSRYQHISFDLFDTLLKRDVADFHDIFVLTGRLWSRDHPGFDVAAYADARRTAERQAREGAKASGHREVTLSEVFAQLPGQYQPDLAELLRIECELELACIVANRGLVDLALRLIAARKRVYVTSNIYFDSEFIDQVLAKLGLRGLAGVYLSCNYDAVKQDGSLFQVLLAAEELRPEELLHIGDNAHADIEGAAKALVKAIRIPRQLPTDLLGVGLRPARPDVDSGMLAAFLENRLGPAAGDRAITDPAERFGYAAFGPLLYGFSRRLSQTLAEQRIDKVFFFSRDGHILKAGYELLYGSEAISTDYLYASRRAYRVPQLWLRPDLADVVDSFPQVSLLSLRAFLNNLGLNPDDYADRLAKHGLSLDQTVKRSQIVGNPTLEALYVDLHDDVMAASRAEHELLGEYLAQHHFSGKVAVVDIGWYGSLQFFLQHSLTDPGTRMHGHYVGLTKQRRGEIEAAGYLVDPGADGTTDAWRGYSGLIEYLFLAQEGSARCFQRGADGRVEPVLYPYEYSADDPEVALVKGIQAGALRFVAEFAANGLSDLIDNDPGVFFALLNRIGQRPTAQVLKLFGPVRFFEETPVSLAQPGPLSGYLRNPAALRRDFYYSKWKIGFMKRLLRIPLPYRQLYELARRL